MIKRSAFGEGTSPGSTQTMHTAEGPTALEVAKLEFSRLGAASRMVMTSTIRAKNEKKRKVNKREKYEKTNE